MTNEKSADLTLVPQMIEEMLRYEAPAQALLRQATADTKIAGSTIPAGSGVMILYGSANRDERQFPNPDVFDVTRNPQEHLAFGFGIHYCIGAPVSRFETRELFLEMTERYTRLERAGASEFEPDCAFRHVARLPVRPLRA